MDYAKLAFGAGSAMLPQGDEHSAPILLTQRTKWFVQMHNSPSRERGRHSMTPSSAQKQERPPSLGAFLFQTARSGETRQTASFAALTGRARTIFRAGFALNIISSPVKGLVPLRALVAGFLMTTNFANPGTRNTPFFFNSL